MTVANDSVLVTPGSGATIATHTINGKEHQAVVVVGPSGHIVDSLDTWYVTADAVALANNKQMLSIYNGASSGKVIKLRKLFLVNLQLAAATGVAVRFDVKRLTTGAPTGGATVTPVAADTTNVAIPAQVVCMSGATGGLVEGSLLFPITFSNDEVGATQAFPSSLLMQATNWLPEGREITELVLRETQGVTVKCVTNTAIGSMAIFAVITVE